MMSTTETLGAVPVQPKWMTIVGWVLTALVSGMLIFSAVSKFMEPSEEILKEMTRIGWGKSLMKPLGVVEAAAAVIFLIPQTAVLGAVLIAGYMGGAIATHVRIGDMFVIQATIGVVAWLGIFLREPRLRRILPLRL
jgi:hypothetical protein